VLDSHKYLHIEFMDGERYVENVEFRSVQQEGGALTVRQKNNARELPVQVAGWPLANIRQWRFSDRKEG